MLNDYHACVIQDRSHHNKNRVILKDYIQISENHLEGIKRRIAIKIVIVIVFFSTTLNIYLQ